jgi:hypothetical protein
MFTPKPPVTSPDLVDITQGESSNDIIANSSTSIASQMTCKKIYNLLHNFSYYDFGEARRGGGELAAGGARRGRDEFLANSRISDTT